MDLQSQLQRTLGSAYAIERELGGGGMSRVFVATEQALGRPVVVKVLPTETAGQVSIERFKREIRLAASLQQANIVPVLTAGDAGGVAYYTMPFVKGESLRSRLGARGALPVGECIAILRDVARALAFAHDEGVVHRDIKPENILLSGGTAVVTDFGIAKAVAASATLPGATTLTHLGVTLGTPAYMAPEQALGQEVDHRADIYSLGVVAYEMLAGTAPFSGRSAQAMLAAHVMEAPAPLAQKCPDAPAGLVSLIMTCLAKEQDDRPPTAADVLATLETAATPQLVMTTRPSRQATIAVMPFANMSADPEAEYFSEGMSEEILNALVRVPGISVIARTSSFAFKGKGVDVREIGNRLGAGVVVEGSVRKAADRVRITAQLIDASSGLQLWSERYDRELRDVFAVQDEITAAIRDALSEKLAGIGAVPQPKATVDPATYELFLKGRFLVNRAPEGLAKGTALLQQVVERAPTYAPGLSEFAAALTLMANFGILEPNDAKPKSSAYATRALEIDPNDPMSHTVLAHNAHVYAYDWATARRHFERALLLGPSHATTLSWYSMYWASLERHSAAIAMSRRAVALDPLNNVSRLLGLFAHHFARRWNDVVSLSDEMVEIDPNFSECYRLRAFALLKLGRIDESLRDAETAVRLSGGHPYFLFQMVLSFLAAGRRSDAEAIVSDFERREHEGSVFSLVIGNLRGPMGDPDAAFAALERYFAQRGHWIAMMRSCAFYDPLRADPRFADLMRRAGIPGDSSPEALLPEPMAGS